MITIQYLEKVEPGQNIFLADAFNMGMDVGVVDVDSPNVAGNRVMVMHSNHPSEQCKYLHIVNERTGERILITF